MEEEIHCTGGISEINLCDNAITTEEVKHLLKFAKQLINKLKTLNLCWNNLDSESCATLAHLIPHVPHLKILNLSCNPNVGQGGAVPLMTSLTTHNSLEKLLLAILVDLSLQFCNIDSDGACQLASALCTNDTLQKLNLTGNPIGVKGATAFAEMLLKNKSLKELNLFDDSIGEEGTQKLIDSHTQHNIEKVGAP